MKSASMVLGILAAFLSLPAALCSGMCAAEIVASRGGTASADANAAGSVFLYLGLASGFIAFVSSILVMVRVRLGLAGLCVALAVTIVTCVTANPLAFGEALFLFVAALLAYLALRDDSRNSMLPPPGVPYGVVAAPYPAPYAPSQPQAQQWGGPPQQPGPSPTPPGPSGWGGPTGRG